MLFNAIKPEKVGRETFELSTFRSDVTEIKAYQYYLKLSTTDGKVLAISALEHSASKWNLKVIPDTKKKQKSRRRQSLPWASNQIDMPI